MKIGLSISTKNEALGTTLWVQELVHINNEENSKLKSIFNENENSKLAILTWKNSKLRFII